MLWERVTREKARSPDTRSIVMAQIRQESQVVFHVLRLLSIGGKPLIASDSLGLSGTGDSPRTTPILSETRDITLRNNAN